MPPWLSTDALSVSWKNTEIISLYHGLFLFRVFLPLKWLQFYYLTHNQEIRDDLNVISAMQSEHSWLGRNLNLAHWFHFHYR